MDRSLQLVLLILLIIHFSIFMLGLIKILFKELKLLLDNNYQLVMFLLLFLRLKISQLVTHHMLDALCVMV